MIPDQEVAAGKSAAAQLLALAGILAFLLILPAIGQVEADKIGVPFNTTKTTVNITNAPPYVSNVTVASPINLQPNSSVVVVCNATVTDLNGFQDVSLVNATLYEFSISTAGAADHHRTHYSNLSCLNISSDASTSNFTCMFNVQYYADNGTWQCNVTARDTFSVTASARGNATINQLIALTVPDLIDYGQVAVLNTSENVEANLTNVGNAKLNVTVQAYGNTSGDGTALICTIGNITYTDQRYSLNSSHNWSEKITPLNGASSMIGNFTIRQMNNSLDDSWNSTEWMLNISQTIGGPGPAGICNGTVLFTGIWART